ncbi:unnamed protein product [Camellia sinensis]
MLNITGELCFRVQGIREGEEHAAEDEAEDEVGLETAVVSDTISETKKEVLWGHHDLRRPRPRGSRLSAWFNPTHRKGPTTKAPVELINRPSHGQISSGVQHEVFAENPWEIQDFRALQESNLTHGCGKAMHSPLGHHPW